MIALFPLGSDRISAKRHPIGFERLAMVQQDQSTFRLIDLDQIGNDRVCRGRCCAGRVRFWRQPAQDREEATDHRHRTDDLNCIPLTQLPGATADSKPPDVMRHSQCGENGSG